MPKSRGIVAWRNFGTWVGETLMAFPPKHLQGDQHSFIFYGCPVKSKVIFSFSQSPRARIFFPVRFLPTLRKTHFPGRWPSTCFDRGGGKGGHCLSTVPPFPAFSQGSTGHPQSLPKRAVFIFFIYQSRKSSSALNALVGNSSERKPGTDPKWTKHFADQLREKLGQLNPVETVFNNEFGPELSRQEDDDDLYGWRNSTRNDCCILA